MSELLDFLSDPANAVLRTRLCKRIWQAAVRDGSASDLEVEFIKSFAAETGMSEAEFVSISLRYYRPKPPDDFLETARGLLGVQRTATVDEVKRAYKRKAREYHPDVHAGAAENLRQLAAERFSQLANAKETLLAALGQVPLVALSPDGELIPAEDQPTKIQCFGCGATQRGATASEAFASRCPRCLMLLYHERAYANELRAETHRAKAATN